MSIREIVWLQRFEFPHKSLALQVRVTEKVEPHSALVRVETTAIVTLVPSARSNAVGALKSHSIPHLTARSGAHATEGGVVSITMTVWLQMLLLPQRSVAVQSRLMIEAPPQLLLTLSEKLTVTALQLSVAVAVPVLPGSVFAGQSRVLLTGTTNVGGVMSRTVIVWMALARLPH